MSSSSYVPANETALSLSGFVNGSVIGQISNFSLSYPNDDPAQLLNLTILPNNLASLTFKATDASVACAFLPRGHDL
jgi:hypothetical protein